MLLLIHDYTTPYVHHLFQKACQKLTTTNVKIFLKCFAEITKDC